MRRGEYEHRAQAAASFYEGIFFTQVLIYVFIIFPLRTDDKITNWMNYL
jgi:hypothetical protein